MLTKPSGILIWLILAGACGVTAARTEQWMLWIPFGVLLVLFAASCFFTLVRRMMERRDDEEEGDDAHWTG